MKKAGSTQLNCFSPPVMIATFVIEMMLAAYTIWRYKLNVLSRLVVTSLLALAVFQLCEYHVCGGAGLRVEQWSRGGFVAITLLPALGVHMMSTLTARPRRTLVRLAYGAMGGFIIYFILAAQAFEGYVCTGNYVIFQIGTWPSLCYAAYYYGLLMTSIFQGVQWLGQHKTGTQWRRQSVRALILGYLVFLVPVALANTVRPDTIRGVPSIMCGFAVIFAFIMVLYILPRSGHKRQVS